MKATGIVRKVDKLGRVVIPIETRRILGITQKDALEIYTEDDRIILHKYASDTACIFCGHTNDVIEFKGQNICRSCLRTLKKKH